MSEQSDAHDFNNDVEPTLRERLHALAAFLPLLEREGCEFGHWVFDNGAYYSFGDVATDLHETVYAMKWIAPGFDWTDWQSSEEAGALMKDPDALARATPEQLARLITTLFRRERFVEGTLHCAHGDGVLTRIVRRAAVLESEVASIGTRP